MDAETQNPTAEIEGYRVRTYERNGGWEKLGRNRKDSDNHKFLEELKTIKFIYRNADIRGKRSSFPIRMPSENQNKQIYVHLICNIPRLCFCNISVI